MYAHVALDMKECTSFLISLWIRDVRHSSKGCISRTATGSEATVGLPKALNMDIVVTVEVLDITLGM